MARPNLKIEVELSGVGLGWTNLTTHVVMDEGVTVSGGIQGTSAQDLLASPGSATFTLRNDASAVGGALGYYSLFHASKRSGWDLGINCRIQLQDPTTSTWYVVFIGRIDVIDPLPGKNAERRVRVTAVDWMNEALTFLIDDIGSVDNKRDDEIFDQIVINMPRQPTATSYSTGLEVFRYSLDTSGDTPETAYSAFAKVLRSGFSMMYVTPAGTLTSINRSDRLLNTTVTWTIPDTSIVNRTDALDARASRSQILNFVRVTTHPRTVDESPTTEVYRQLNAIQIPAGPSEKFIGGSYRDPDTGEPCGATEIERITGPIMSGPHEDYEANTIADGSGTDYTDTIQIEIHDGASGVTFYVLNPPGNPELWLTLLRLEGKRVFDLGPFHSKAQDDTSIAAYGQRSLVLDLDYQEDPFIGDAMAEYILGRDGNPNARAETVTIVGKTTAILTSMLTATIGDRVTVSETVTGLNTDFFINHIERRLTGESGDLEQVMRLAPAIDPFGAPNYWQVGTAGDSEIGTTSYLGF